MCARRGRRHRFEWFTVPCVLIAALAPQPNGPTLASLGGTRGAPGRAVVILLLAIFRHFFAGRQETRARRLKAHWGEIAATDFFTTEVWTVTGLRTIYVLFFIELKTRRVHVASTMTNPTDWFIGKAVEGSVRRLRTMRYVIRDRDGKYSLRFRIVREHAGIEPIKTPSQVPNSNAYAERLVPFELAPRTAHDSRSGARSIDSASFQGRP